MESGTTLKHPDLIVMHEVVQAYGTLVKDTVADDRWCCRWPDTRLALQSSCTKLILDRLHGCKCCQAKF
eukprot:6804917-Pyramimonas_sp.AAC.1